MTVDVIWLSGTGYGAQPDGVSAAFAAALPDRFRFVPVRYPASYIHPISYAESVQRGREAVIDPITALPAGNPLRSIADVTEYMTLSDPVSAHRWGEDLLRRAVEGRWQRWWSPANWRSWGGAIAYARGYLVDGRHTADYVLYGHAAHLARIVAEEVR
ncbi:hypothetical protein [Nocardia farcinica]|uniref:hypothetical protein n=1 Tax=Nocardia farcinica TaxID=37329 RepID=UPI001892FD6A|nr:hypothetical protein [Nocardia farcinica]MBF6254448.1 hypothetical protein [Nocardia farcinica]